MPSDSTAHEDISTDHKPPVGGMDGWHCPPPEIPPNWLSIPPNSTLLAAGIPDPSLNLPAYLTPWGPQPMGSHLGGQVDHTLDYLINLMTASCITIRYDSSQLIMYLLS